MFALQVALMKGQGGVFTSQFHYARMWAANGVRSACLYRGPGADILRAGGVDVIDAPANLLSPLFRLSPEFKRLQREIRARAGGGDPYCAMVHSDRAMPAIKAMLPSTVVMTRCHTDKTKHKRPADLVVTLNEKQQQMVAAKLPGVRVKMFGNPFAPDPAEPGPSGEPGRGGRVRINFIGRVEPVKDPLTLVRAFTGAALPANAELRIIGNGSQDDAIAEIARTSAHAITQVGWMEQPFGAFDAGDVLVLPSLWESYSWVVREAVFHGVPVLASDIYVYRDTLGDGAYGWLFPVGDEAALRVLLERAAGSVNELRAMAAAGRDALLARYGAIPFWRALSAEIEVIRAARNR